MTYDDIVRAEQKRAAKVSTKDAKRDDRYPQGSKPDEEKRLRADELKINKRKIEASRFVLQS